MKTYDIYLIESETGRSSMTWSGIFKVEKSSELFELYLNKFSSEDKRSERVLENFDPQGLFSIYDTFWGKTVAIFEPRNESEAKS